MMIAKVLLHIRLGQAGHVYDIFVVLFDILSDTEIIGINKPALLSLNEQKWKKPELFSFKDD